MVFLGVGILREDGKRAEDKISNAVSIQNRSITTCIEAFRTFLCRSVGLSWLNSSQGFQATIYRIISHKHLMIVYITARMCDLPPFPAVTEIVNQCVVVLYTESFASDPVRSFDRRAYSNNMSSALVPVSSLALSTATTQSSVVPSDIWSDIFKYYGNDIRAMTSLWPNRMISQAFKTIMEHIASSTYLRYTVFYMDSGTFFSCDSQRHQFRTAEGILRVLFLSF